MLPPYSPESYVNFNQDEPRRKMLAAFKQVAGELGRTYPLWINGEPVTTGDSFDSVSPADPSRVVGTFAKANTDIADNAVRSAA